RSSAPAADVRSLPSWRKGGPWQHYRREGSQPRPAGRRSLRIRHRADHESLIALNKDTGLPEPRLAERFEQSPDARTLTFVVRDGLQWSDGSPFTGDDFLFTAEAVMRSKKTIWKNRFQDIAGARDFADGKAQTIAGIVVSGTTITVTFSQPSCAALSLMG